MVDDTRAIAAFLHLTSAEGGWRVVVVDGADDMNRNAANALLKVLEEPPKRAVLLLISDNPGRLLPTIRSRCRMLRSEAAAGSDCVEAITAPSTARICRRRDALALARLAEGSIGRALDPGGDGWTGLYRDMYRLLGELPEIDAEALHGFAERLARDEGQRLPPAGRALARGADAHDRAGPGTGRGHRRPERETLARLARGAALINGWRLGKSAISSPRRTASISTASRSC